MKRLFIFALIVAILFSIVACKTTKEEEKPQEVEVQAPVVEEPVVQEEPVVSEPVEEKAVLDIDTSAADSGIPGKLYQLNLAEGEAPAIRGIGLEGNIAGSGDDKLFSSTTATEGIRFIFELLEWIEFYLDTDLKEGITAYALPHQKDSSIYTAKYLEGLETYAAIVDLMKPETAGDTWGSFFISSEDNKAGFYDLVLAVEGKPVAMVIVRLFEENQLSEKPNETLEKIMEETIESAKQMN